MDSKVTWILLLILLSYCLAQDSNISSSDYEVTTSQGDRTIPTSEVNEDESTSGSLLNDNETLVLGTIEVEEWITSDNSSVTETSPQPTYSISTTEDPFPQGQGADDEINTVLATTNENTASKMKVIMSLWNEVINLAGNDSKTQEWTDIASSLWKDMLFQDWNELSVSKWNENMTLLWNEIMIYLEDLDDEPIDPSWNNTMVMLWNDFFGSHMTGLSTQSYFTDSDKGQSFSPNYIGIPAHPAWVPEYENTDWHSYPDYGIEHYPEWSQYGGTVYKDFNITSYTNGPPSLDDEAVEVVLIQGTILGRKERAKRGKSYFYSFKGIPYGEPPVGNLRFMDPIPAAPWNGTRDGTKDPQRCPQLQFYITVGEEDCLYLNVYTPMASEGNLPVMVWIHGGSFVTGGADEYPPLPFMSKNIVLVTIQYRLGTLGFLSTEDSIMPGNLGLKDQTLALQWVNKNIQALGGDPNKITIFGQGAGAASVHLHVISPKARGLFQRAIMQSGSALNQAVIRTDHKEVAMTVGKEYNCSAGDGELFNSTLLLQCLQTLPLKHIVAVPSLFTMIVSLPRVMTPRVDGDFLPDHPAHLLKQGTYNKVDVISGITEHEGAIVALPFLLNPWLVNELMGNFEVAGPALVSTEKEKEPVKLARDILDYYFHGHPVSMAMGDNFIQMISDVNYRFGHDAVIQIHAGDANLGFNTYSYEFQYRGQYSYTDNYGPDAGMHWVSHGDDLSYLFNNRLTVLRRRDDLQMSELMVNLWTNFALTGNPTPDDALGVQWLPVSPTCFHYLAIDRIPYMRPYYAGFLMEFWKSLPLQTNRFLNPPHKWQSFVPSKSTIQNCWNYNTEY